ncbi:class I adenylate-forming enzyme family protein [Brevundimonas sp. TWP2-3-4b2]|uniref:class I adenylate-forming enzyme family protein n=1 Tax=Brevundimonas sp. TWP2-3-4b2 TaxID=2804595 RepID=UPI003CF72F62
MSVIDFLKARLLENADERVLGFRGESVTGRQLFGQIEASKRWLADQGVGSGTTVVLIGDFTFEAIGHLLALVELGAITAPLTRATLRSVEEQLDEIEPDLIVDAEQSSVERRARPVVANAHYQALRERDAAGLVLFTSGSTGRPKAVVHDFSRLLEKFHDVRPAMVTLNFLLFDHWGGLNTLLHSLSSGSMLVLPDSRKPDDICTMIDRYRIELLPATPSFLNMLLISGAVQRHDLSSLKVISFGAEPMPASTLDRLRVTFPAVDLRQTYGMIELGVLRAKSRSDGSLWVKLGGKGYDLRVVDGMLEIKATATMLGYINHPSPITEDGYFRTGDLVEEDGEYLKILGRKSDLINVGGQKVYPAEVETVLLEVDGVLDASVHGEAHVLTGKIVVARVVIPEGHDPAEMRKTIKRHCAERLQPYMVPTKISFETGQLQNHRLKRQRL